MEPAKSFNTQNKKKGTVINLEQGKIPPQAVDLKKVLMT